MATIFDIFSTSQCSVFLRINNQVPAHAVAVTNASRKGTLLEVNVFKIKNKIPHDTHAIIAAMNHSADVVLVMDARISCCQRKIPMMLTMR